MKTKTEIDGSAVCHRIITDACRAGHSDQGALDTAFGDAMKDAKKTLDGWPHGRGMRLHVVVTVEPGTSEAATEDKND